MFQRLTRDPRALLPALGALVVLATTAVASMGSLLAIPFALWSLVPWAVLFALRRSTLSAWTLGGAGVAALAAEIGIRAAVFVWPRGSTAAVALVFSPAVILVAVMPAGAALGWLAGRAWPAARRHRGRRVRQHDGGGPAAVRDDRGTGWRARRGTGACRSPGRAGDRPRTLEPRRTIVFPDRRGGFWTSFAALVRMPDGSRERNHVLPARRPKIIDTAHTNAYTAARFTPT